MLPSEPMSKGLLQPVSTCHNLYPVLLSTAISDPPVPTITVLPKTSGGFLMGLEAEKVQRRRKGLVESVMVRSGVRRPVNPVLGPITNTQSAIMRIMPSRKSRFLSDSERR